MAFLIKFNLAKERGKNPFITRPQCNMLQNILECSQCPTVGL